MHVRSILSVLILVIMSCGLTGVAVYRWQQDRTSSSTQKLLQLQQEVSDLQFELNAVEDELSQYQQLDTAELDDMRRALCTNLNTDAATTAIEYENKEKGIALSIPYNEQWGFGVNIPAPYQQLELVDGILFGSPVALESDACAWSHSLQLTFLPARDQEALEQDLRARDGTTALQEVTVGQQNFWQYSVQGRCALMNYELQGTQWNYVFSTCDNTDTLKEVMQSVRLL